MHEPESCDLALRQALSVPSPAEPGVWVFLLSQFMRRASVEATDPANAGELKSAMFNSADGLCEGQEIASPNVMMDAAAELFPENPLIQTTQQLVGEEG